MATTALTTVNNVLSRLREAAVTSATFATNSYAQLVLRFVNEAKRECEDAWDWLCLRQTLSFTTTSSVQGYTLTGAGQRFRFYDRRQLVLDSTNRIEIYPAEDALIEEATQLWNVNNQFPNWYRIRGVDSNGDPNLDFYPVPNGSYVMKIPLVIPQADLSAYSDTFKISPAMVELGAWAKAISERGEDGGQTTQGAYEVYRFALSDAISQDSALASGELVWTS